MDDRRPQPAPEESGLSATEREALQAVRSLRPVTASDSARARTRRAFLEAAPVAAPAPTPRSPRPRSGWMGMPAVALATAAAVILLLYGTQPAEPWTITNTGVSETAVRNGETIQLVLGEALPAGPLAVAAEDEIEIQWGELVLRTRGDAAFDLPSPPGRWFGQNRVLKLQEGEVYGSSGETGPGFELTLVTPEARARLTGTTFAVFRTDEATCFCLFRGGLAVTPLDGDDEIVLPVGHRILFYKDGRAPSIETLDAGEQMKLQMIDDAASQP